MKNKTMNFVSLFEVSNSQLCCPTKDYTFQKDLCKNTAELR